MIMIEKKIYTYLFAEQNTCEDGKFRCLSGQCIWNHGICNGRRDCEDGSDEEPHGCCTYRYKLK